MGLAASKPLNPQYILRISDWRPFLPSFRIPKMSHHKASDQAIVRLGGRDFYLGPWHSKTARNEYDRLIAEWLAGGRRAPKASTDGLTITEMLAAFWDHAEVYYRHPDGTPSSEIHCLRDALKMLRRLYGQGLRAKQFVRRLLIRTAY